MRLLHRLAGSHYGSARRWNSLLTLLLAVFFGAGYLAAQQPQLIPQPREVKVNAERFRATPDLQIILLALADEDRYAGESLQDELQTVTGQKVPIVASAASPGKAAILLGRLDQSSMRALLEARGINADKIGAEGYVLDVGPDRIFVAGKDTPGLFYGVQTLRQLVVGNGQSAEVLGVRIRDWPALPYRGTQVDMARGPVPTLTHLKRIVRTIAEFKLNQLYMYMEDSFRLDGHPLVGVLSDTLSREDWKELVAYAARYHVDIIPAQNSFGHFHKTLRFEQYSGLGERPHGNVLAPEEPSYAFLKELYEQMVSVFPSTFYHIGCDETWELGRGRSAARVQLEGVGKVYLENLKQVANILKPYNKQVIFWGDIALEHPEVIKDLPNNLIVASWQYSAEPSYEKWIKPYVDAGLKVIVCPWIGNAGQMMPDFEEAAANIGKFTEDGKKWGAIGVNNTVWNDDGETLYGVNWWSIVYGAACAWEQQTPTVGEFDQKYDWAFYRNQNDHRFVGAIKKLSRLNGMLRSTGLGETCGQTFGGTQDELFWRDPYSAPGREDLRKALPVAGQLRRQAEEAYVTFSASAGQAQRHTDTLANLRFVALRLDALGMRCQYMQATAERYATLLANQSSAGRGSALNELCDVVCANGYLQDLRDYTTKLRDQYQELWLSENLPGWLPNMLQLYDRQSLLWQDKISVFTQIYYDFSQKKPLPTAESLGLMAVPPSRK
jgi:hexosaminidase